MEKYILDANLFFNMEAGVDLGIKTQDVVVNITKIAKRLKEEKKADFIIPPRVVDEFLSFFEDKNQPFIKNFLSTITIKSPDISKTETSTNVFYLLIDEIRQRSYRGLNIGEEEIEKAGRLMVDQKNLSKKEFEIKIGEVIKKFRERYRTATRVGFLDSVADLDLIILAKEQDGVLVTTDEGVLKWARIFGVKEMPAGAWGKQLLHQE
jgi:hypothetical protein